VSKQLSQTSENSYLETLLTKAQTQRTEVDRPSWDEVFMAIAHVIAQRSPDSQTKVGAVLVDNNHHVLSLGYNGWVPGIDDSILPNTRPSKYPFMLHAELNCVLQCTHRPVGATLYVTHKPCLHCFSVCVASGIKELVYRNIDTFTSCDEEDNFNLLQYLTKDKIVLRSVS
jgi:dCMP deaminase